MCLWSWRGCQSFHGQYFKIEHFPIAADGKNDGPVLSVFVNDELEYKHLHKTTYLLNADRLYSWAYFGIDYSDNFDVSDWADYADCPAVVPGTNGIPNPDPNKVDDEMLIDPGEASNPRDPVVTTPATPDVPVAPTSNVVRCHGSLFYGVSEGHQCVAFTNQTSEYAFHGRYLRHLVTMRIGFQHYVRWLKDGCMWQV